MLRFEDAQCGTRGSVVMRYRLVLSTILVAAFAIGAPIVTSAGAAPGAVDPVGRGPGFVLGGWRRYYDYPGAYAVPPVVAPAPAVTPPVVVQQPVVVVPPPRPTSCGEFHYWNGQYCVDARYNRP